MDSIKVTVYKCSICDNWSYDKNLADKCCEIKQCECGKDTRPHYFECDDCMLKSRYEKAKKIKYSDYSGTWLYDNESERFFIDKEAMEDYYYEDGNVNDMPKWVHACEENVFCINIDRCIENAEEEMYDDFEDIVDKSDLLLFVEEWNSKQIGKSYDVDCSTIIIFD